MKTTLRRSANPFALLLTTALALGVQLQPVLAQPDTLAAREAKQDWMQAELTLDNSAYASTRAQIDKLVRQGEDPSALESRYQLKGNDRYDSQKIFRWAYASYRKQKLDPEPNGLAGIEESMNRNLRPGAYDWVRLRFLIASLQTFLRPTMPLIQVGHRLLDVQANDEEVTFHLVRSLKDSQSLEDRKQAVSLAKANARKNSRDVYWQWTLANAVSNVDDFAGRPTYKGNQASLVEYKKTLRMLPAGHPYRKRLIETIVRFDLKFDTKGNRRVYTRKDYKDALKNTTLR